MAVGIERIAAYPCTLSLDMRTLAEARDHDPNHPIGELWVTSRSLNPVWEDPVTMAVNAALQVVSPADRDDIELVIVGTESSMDFGKPMSTYVQRFCGITPNCRNFETKHACYGGTSGLMMAAHWVASGAAPGKKALVVTSDQSRMHLGQPWEYVLGAAATAMLVSASPDVSYQVVVRVMDALRRDEPAYLTTDDAIARAGGVQREPFRQRLGRGTRKFRRRSFHDGQGPAALELDESPFTQGQISQLIAGAAQNDRVQVARLAAVENGEKVHDPRRRHRFGLLGLTG